MLRYSKFTDDMKVKILFYSLMGIALIVMIASMIWMTFLLPESESDINWNTHTTIVENYFNKETSLRLKRLCEIKEDKEWSDDDLKIISVENRVKAALDKLEESINFKREKKILELKKSGRWSN